MYSVSYTSCLEVNKLFIYMKQGKFLIQISTIYDDVKK